jgi:hypothetical protein
VGAHDATHNPPSEVRRETPFFVPTLLDRHQSGINPLEQEVAKSDIRPVRAPNGVLGSCTAELHDGRRPYTCRVDRSMVSNDSKLSRPFCPA